MTYDEQKNNGVWVNLTPHSIRVMCPDRVTLAGEFPPSGQVARVATTTVLRGTVAGIAVYDSVLGSVTGLPPVAVCEDGESVADRIARRAMRGQSSPETSGDVQRFIVSLAVRVALPHDARLFSPGELIRDAAGQPVGCIGLVGNGGGL